MTQPLMVITGVNGMIGSHIARRAVAEGFRVRGTIRPTSDRSLLEGLDIELVEADMADPDSLMAAVSGANVVVHTAAHIGDWGPAEKYRAINVVGLEHLLAAVEQQANLERFVHVSTLGVYPARHHYGTDETVPPDLKGLDGYTRTKAEAEQVVLRHIRQENLPAVILRPGFVYGPGERYVIPQLIEKLKTGKMKLIGKGDKVLNNTYVGNFVDAVFLALKKSEAVGEIFNIRDKRLVTRQEYIHTVADYLGLPRPGHVPLWLAKLAVGPIETWARITGRKTAPILTRARMKFMTLNLDFSIAKAQQVLGYDPQVDFQEGIRVTLDWFKARM